MESFVPFFRATSLANAARVPMTAVRKMAV